MLTPALISRPGTEAAHQQALFAWAALNSNLYPVLASKAFFAIKNEEKTGSVVIGAKSKAMGVKAGVADIFLAHPVGRYHGLFLEMKKPNGIQSSEQKQFAKDVFKTGYKYVIAYGWEDAKNLLVSYLNGCE